MRQSSDLTLRPVRRERLLRPWHLLFIGLMGLLVLAGLAPNSQTLETTFARPDRLSLTYLRLLSAVRPNDLALKLHLVRALVALQQFDEASSILASAASSDPKLRLWAWRLSLQVHIAQFTADPQRAKSDPKLQQVLGQEIAALVDEPLAVDELSGLAASSLIVGRPDLAARIFMRMSEIDPRQRARWLAEAAKQTHASGQPEQAGMLYDKLSQSDADPQDSRKHALEAMSALTHADRGEKALAVASRYATRFKNDVEVLAAAAKLALANNKPDVAFHHYDALVELTRDDAARRRYARLAIQSVAATSHADGALPAVRRYLHILPSDPQLLSMGVQLALAHKQPRLAQEWGRALLKQEPNNGSRIASQISVELAIGDVASALELARRLVARQPKNFKARERLAQIAEWSGHPNEALEEWTYLALHTQNTKYFDRAMKMAPQLYELELLAKLLARKAEHGRMSSSELLSLITVFEDIGEPERLVQLLEAYLRHEPDHLEAWQALAQLHERRGDLDAAVATWERISREFGSSTKEITHRAELLWEQQKPEQAYVLLRDALDRAGAAMTRDLLTRSELSSMPQSSIGAAKQSSAGAYPSSTDAKDKEKAKEKLADETRQNYLARLGQLFWFSEPQPESLEEYRKLWRQEALIQESAERYILLAKTEGLIDEAIQIAEAAFKRFRNPEFLMSAMDLAYNHHRWDDLERLVDTAHGDAELFAENKYYYILLAEHYIHQRDFDRAQQVYLRIIALDPNAVAARANLLWMLIDHAGDYGRNRGKRHRLLLANLLTNWRHFAEHQPALWLPFATGWALLGRSKEALSFYGREWTQRPTDHLWLVGYVSTLEAVSRSSDAHRLRRFAIAALRPEALRAAHRNATTGEREVLKAYVELVRDVYGPGKGSRWLSQVMHLDLDPGVHKGLAAVWRSNGEEAVPSAWVTASSTVAQRNPWGRYPKTVKQPKSSQNQEQATIADASVDPQESEEPAPAPLLVLAPDASAGEERLPARLLMTSVEAGVQSINDLLILSTNLAIRFAHGAFGVGGHIGVNHLFLDQVADPQAAATDVDIAAYGQWRHRLGRLEIGIGNNIRSDASLLQGWVTETFNLWRGGTLQVGVHLNELPYDTRWLRLYAARHHAQVGLATSFLTDGVLGLQANFYQYHTRTNEELGAGFNLEGELGYRIRRVRPLWTARISGSLTRNYHLRDSVPVFGGGSSSISLLDALPTEFAAVGVGTHVEHRFPGVTPIGAGRWRYMADAWVGWMWPMNIAAFEVRSGVGLALPHKQEISLTGFIANNRWLGPGVVNAGVTLRYLFH